MGKKNKIVPFPDYLTTTHDGKEKRYIRLGNTLLLHDVVLNLSKNAFRIYVYMLLESGGKQTFSFSYNKFKKLTSKQGFQNAKSELIESGLIVQIASNKNLRKSAIYSFSSEWKK